MADTSLKFYRGDDQTINVNIVDDNGDAVNITGYTFWLTVKNQEADSDADCVFQKVVTSHSNPTQGQTQIAISKTNTNQEIGSYYYDVQMKDVAGNVTTIVKGRFVINRDITQSYV